MKKPLIFVPLFVIATIIAAQCGPPPVQESAPPTTQGDEPRILVMEPWSRPSPMTAGNGVVYMILVNEGRSADLLVSVETDVAEVVELHETKMEGDVMKMGPIPNIQVPAGGSAKLEPGGMHMMLINLKQELTPGDKIPLTLQFEKSGLITVEAEVRASGEGMEDDMDMQPDTDQDRDGGASVPQAARLLALLPLVDLIWLTALQYNRALMVTFVIPSAFSLSYPTPR
jgi:copper(I)-binding protein